MTKDRQLSDRLNRSLFFLLAILFHLVLFLTVVGYVVFPPHPEPKDTGFNTTVLPAVTPTPPSPPVNPPTGPTLSGLDTILDVHTSNTVAGYSVVANFHHELDAGAGVSAAHDPNVPLRAVRQPLTVKGPVDLEAVKEAHEFWDPTHSGRMKFPIYLAKYADGDWDCNHYFHADQLTSGCLPNLLAKVEEWSHGDIKGVGIKVVALDSPELIEKPAPFLFFTGHKDFHLTDAEIANLRRYLENGGAIWGDSAFAGDGSRFDIAFHREMKRVLPDVDIAFQTLPSDHDIFTHSKFQIEEVPPGMNHRADPIEYMNLGDKLAVIYTPNDYSDMMTMLLLPGRDERSAQMAPETWWTAEHPLFTPGNFVFHQAAYFRNYEADSAMASYKLSMNILVHLLHRYDEELLLAP